MSILPSSQSTARLARTARCREFSKTEEKVAYTGEGVEGSELAFDKIRSKEKFREHGVTTPEWETVKAGQRPRMELPIVVKPPRQGSTVGVYIVKKPGELESAMADAAKFDQELLIEKFVPGRELTIGILGDQALPILEIIPKGGFYDFTNKYPFLNPQAGGGAEHVCPAKIDEKKTKEIQELALAAFRSSVSRFMGASIFFCLKLAGRRSWK